MKHKDVRGKKINDMQNRFYTFVMPKRSSANCWTQLSVNAENMLRFIKDKKENGENYTVFQTVVAALIRTGSQFPQLNRYIFAHRLHARNDFTISFAVSLGKEVALRKVRFTPDMTISQIHEIIENNVASARENPHDSLDKSMDFMMKLPNFLASFIFKLYPKLVNMGIFPKKFADEDPLYASAMVSNLGTFGLNAPYHHLYDWGNISVFITIGIIEKVPSVMPDDSIKAVSAISIGFNVDERITGGKVISDALTYFKNVIENPEILESPPDKVIIE
ncbi:MAG: 2-oxo acid dehydrogenase subunit E2 [Eubacteriales bacterium]|nr:2-oxo acid dehydrogenase subunit E2 [Eubacteriales bacterium]